MLAGWKFALVLPGPRRSREVNVEFHSEPGERGGGKSEGATGQQTDGGGKRERRGRKYILICRSVSVKACSGSNYEHWPVSSVPLQTDESIAHPVTALQGFPRHGRQVQI